MLAKLENHHLWWENSLLMAIFNSFLYVGEVGKSPSLMGKLIIHGNFSIAFWMLANWKDPPSLIDKSTRTLHVSLNVPWLPVRNSSLMTGDQWKSSVKKLGVSRNQRLMNGGYLEPGHSGFGDLEEKNVCDVPTWQKRTPRVPAMLWRWEIFTGASGEHGEAATILATCALGKMRKESMRDTPWQHMTNSGSDFKRFMVLDVLFFATRKRRDILQ